MRRFEEAITLHHQARDIFHELEDPHNEAHAWGSLECTLVAAQRFELAIDAYERDIAIREKLGTASATHGPSKTSRTHTTSSTIPNGHDEQ